MTEALSVSLRLSSDVVVRQTFRSAFAVGILDLSFFFPPISPSLYHARLYRDAYRIHRKVDDGGDVSPCSRVTSRRLSETHAYETCHASFLWKETRSVQVRPRWDRPRFHEQARGRSSSSPFWGESKIIPILGYCKKSGALRTSLHATDFVLNYALSSALIMNLFDAVPLILTAAFDRGEFNSRPFVIRL